MRTYFLFCSRACFLLLCPQSLCVSLCAAAESKGSQRAQGGHEVVATTHLTSQANHLSPLSQEAERKSNFASPQKM